MDLLVSLHRQIVAAGIQCLIIGEISGRQRGERWPSPGRKMAANGSLNCLLSRYPYEGAAAVLRAWRDAAHEAPDTLGPEIGL